MSLLGSFGNLGGRLFSAGASVIRGFINGIVSMFGSVRSTLRSLTSKFPVWKGPAERDAGLLFGSGVLIMGGFQKGLESRYDAIRDSLGGYTTGLVPAAPAFGSSSAAARTQAAGGAMMDPVTGQRSRALSVTIVQHNPVAESTSVSTNRALNYVKVLGL